MTVAINETVPDETDTGATVQDDINDNLDAMEVLQTIGAMQYWNWSKDVGDGTADQPQFHYYVDGEGAQIFWDDVSPPNKQVRGECFYTDGGNIAKIIWTHTIDAWSNSLQIGTENFEWSNGGNLIQSYWTNYLVGIDVFAPSHRNNGTEFCEKLRNNFKEFRQNLVMCAQPGWRFYKVDGSGSADLPEFWFFQNQERPAYQIRATVTYGATGGSTGNVTVVIWAVFAGGNLADKWNSFGIEFYTYHADGYVTAQTWSNL